MIPHVTGAAHQTALLAHVRVHSSSSQRIRCSTGHWSRRLPCQPVQPICRHGLQMTRRGRLLIVAATPEGGGGWLTQWIQSFMPGGKDRAAAEDAAKQSAVEEPRSPGVCEIPVTLAAQG
jgi:hypothetical protein